MSDATIAEAVTVSDIGGSTWGRKTPPERVNDFDTSGFVI